MPGLSVNAASSELRNADPSSLQLPAAFEVCFNGLSSEGMMGTMPRSAAEVPAEVAGHGYNAALRKRLQQLGYLKSANATVPQFDSALRRFQQDAGLVVDGWNGAQTWDALQQLFTFEDPFQAERWFTPEGQPLPALNRALRLRLRAYGQWPSKGQALHALADAFTQWLTHARLLGWEPPPVADPLATGGPDDITPARVARLFDHDEIVAFAAAHPERCNPAFYGANAAAMRQFLLALAKVELWLNGYPVAPDGDTRLTVRTTVQPAGGGAGGRRPRRRRQSDSAFFDVVETFLHNTQGSAVTTSRSLAALSSTDTNTRLDQAIASILMRTQELREAEQTTQTPPMSDEDLAKLVLAQPRPKSFWKKLVKTARGLASSLFDGVRRVWRWLRERVSSVLSWAKESLVNLTRAVWHRLTAIGRIIRAAIHAFAEGVAYFVQPVLAFSNPRDLVMAHDVDFDFHVHVAAGADDGVVQQKIRSLRRGVAAWKVACQIIGLATTVTRATLQGANVLGLIFVASGLIRIAGQLRELGTSLANYMELNQAQPLIDVA